MGRLSGHVQSRARNGEEVAVLRANLSSFLSCDGVSHGTDISPGQPLRLQLFRDVVVYSCGPMLL